MIRAGAGFSTLPIARAALDQALAQALDGLARVDAALLFAGPGYGDELPAVLDAAVAALGTDAVVGASVHGVLGCGQEAEGGPGLSLLALGGVEAEPFLVTDVTADPVATCEDVVARLGEPRPEDLVVLLPDPTGFDQAAFLPALRAALGPAVVVGAGAGDPLGGDPLQWSGRVVASGGIGGLVLRGETPPRVGVTQGCRPVTELLTVTEARGHWILEIGGRPALEVYREAARGPLGNDLRRAAGFVLVGLPVDPENPDLRPGSYLVRHPIGFDPDANAFAIPEQVPVGRSIALVHREPESAREDLKTMLEGVGGPAACGLYFDCCARGEGFFGFSGLEAGYLQAAFPDVPLAGMFGSCELGPIGGRTELLTYTGVLALLGGR